MSGQLPANAALITQDLESVGVLGVVLYFHDLQYKKDTYLIWPVLKGGEILLTIQWEFGRQLVRREVTLTDLELTDLQLSAVDSWLS